VKKKRSTANILIVICIETRQILYLSPSFPGSKNNNAITKHKWLDKFSEEERGLGDDGFRGMTS
jgi:hypothetical protein